MPALDQIVKAVDNMSEWADKINLSFGKADANEVRLDADEGRLDAAEARITVNEADIDTNTAAIVVNAADIDTNAAGIVDILDGTSTHDLVKLDLTADPAWVAGQLSYDPDAKTGRMDTGYPGVRVQLGQEDQVPFLNTTGAIIKNGFVINAGGVDFTTKELIGNLCDISDVRLSSSVIGLATAEVAIGAMGIATRFGKVHTVDPTLLVGLTEGGVLYAGATLGTYTQDFPRHPNTVLVLGTVLDVTAGTIFLDIKPFIRPRGSRSYSFTQAGTGTGEYFLGGFYDHQAAAQTITDVSDYAYPGFAGVAHASHPFAVASGVGTTGGGGTVGLRIVGTKIDEQGNQTVSTATVLDEEIVFNDIEDALEVGTGIAPFFYGEASAKYLGTPTYELFVSSGTPATPWSFTCNVGLAKYEDVNNQDFTVTGFDCLFNPGSAVALFDMELLHHSQTGWTYNATTFVPGDGVIAKWSEDVGAFNTLVVGTPIPWKRSDLAWFVDGNGPEGILIRVNAPATQTIQNINFHVAAVIEQIA